MRLAVIIINWNHYEATLKQVQTLGDWQHLKPTLIVVDNASADRSNPAYLRFEEHAIVLESEINRGYAGGNNLGIKKALQLQTDYIMLLNADAELTEIDARNLLDALENDQRIGAIGPLLHNFRNKKTYRGGRDLALYLDSRIEWEPTPPDSILQEVDYVPGTVMTVKASLFEDAGLLDERFFFGGSTADWCFRIRQMGYLSYIHTKTQATHRASDPAGLRSSLYTYYSLRNRFLFQEKWHHKNLNTLRRLWSIRCLRQLIGALAMARFRRARAIWLALKDGRRGNFGNQNHLFMKTGF